MVRAVDLGVLRCKLDHPLRYVIGRVGRRLRCVFAVLAGTVQYLDDVEH